MVRGGVWTHLPQVVLDMPRFGCLKYRRFAAAVLARGSAIERALLAGDMQTGVCIMQMEAGLIPGRVLLRGRSRSKRATPRPA